MKVDKDELRKRLDPTTYRVTQEQGTEAPFEGEYWDANDPGYYHCKVCGQRLFSSENKFQSRDGWPSFDRALPGAVEEKSDDRYFMHRTEVVCSNCGAHLGHRFDDGPRETTGQHFCVNSCALDLKKEKL